MPRPALRSRSMRRVKKRLPGGSSVIHYSKKKPSKPICSGCKKPLHGVPRDLPQKIEKLPKTKKRPERPYGGKLCSKCLRETIKLKIPER